MPPSARRSMFGRGMGWPGSPPAEFRSPPAWASRMWSPPPPVSARSVAGSAPALACSWARESSPWGRSTSITTSPDRAPVAMPTLAHGQRVHQAPAIARGRSWPPGAHAGGLGASPDGCSQAGRSGSGRRWGQTEGARPSPAGCTRGQRRRGRVRRSLGARLAPRGSIPPRTPRPRCHPSPPLPGERRRGRSGRRAPTRPLPFPGYSETRSCADFGTSRDTSVCQQVTESPSRYPSPAWYLVPWSQISESPSHHRWSPGRCLPPCRLVYRMTRRHSYRARRRAQDRKW